MRRLLAVVTLVLLPALLPGEDKKDEKKKEEPAPNKLTKDEIEKGYLLLFDGETTFGWKIDGEAKVEKGSLVLGGDKPGSATTTTHFADAEVVIDCVWKGQTRPSFTVRGNPVPPIVLSLWKGDGARRVSFKAEKRIYQYKHQGEGLLGNASSTFRGEDQSGSFGLAAPKGTTLEVRSVRMRPLGTAPLFDGKSLDGWKVYKGDKKREKSKFTVTKEGWLNVKDGAGDLQTEKKYDDFVLQLECISNGKHLNSGIFFRCLPGEYQQGYEAQIRNEFKEKDQKYTVEEYDPKTNKLTGKKEVLSPAFDYGTGAIYRRMPARKQVSKDNEWFTLTVVARGRHLATWVNGVQQVDWTDNRPAGKNAREGYYADAGCISIQGHDPTTDLSFRNFRIAPLPKKKD